MEKLNLNVIWNLKTKNLKITMFSNSNICQTIAKKVFSNKNRMVSEDA